MEEFELKEEHLKLLQRANWDWNGMEFGAPTIDPKKPYGNSFPIRDMCKILGIEYPNEDDYLDDMEEYDRRVDERILQLTPLHEEMLQALQVIFSTGSMEPGLYRKKRKYGSDWERMADSDA